MTPEEPQKFPRFSDAALRDWNQHVEEMMRGIAHALNNRAAALSAVLELSREPDGGGDQAVMKNILTTELSRVRELADIVRLVGPPRSGTEAFSPDEAAQQAAAVLRLLTDHGDRITFVDARGAPPIRVERWMFVRALVVLGATARVDRVTEPVPVHVAGDAEWLEVRLTDAAAPPAASVYLAELVQAMGGELLATRGFRVPTLAAIRQREGR
jgi:hypothetical protein